MELKVGQRYKHSKKGTFYKIIALAKHSETLEDLVVYEVEYENPVSKVWVRPLALFVDKIILNGEEKNRFELIS